RGGPQRLSVAAGWSVLAAVPRAIWSRRTRIPASSGPCRRHDTGGRRAASVRVGPVSRHAAPDGQWVQARLGHHGAEQGRTAVPALHDADYLCLGPWHGTALRSPIRPPVRLGGTLRASATARRPVWQSPTRP